MKTLFITHSVKNYGEFFTSHTVIETGEKTFYAHGYPLFHYTNGTNLEEGEAYSPVYFIDANFKPAEADQSAKTLKALNAFLLNEIGTTYERIVRTQADQKSDSLRWANLCYPALADENRDTDPEIIERLDYFRTQIHLERISYAEIGELGALADHIDASDTVLLEWAGVPEFTAPKS
jgi:hypothetical protein